MLKRRMLLSVVAVVAAYGATFGIGVPSASAGPVAATGVISCSMTGVTTLVGKVVRGLSVVGNHPVVQVKFAATFSCSPAPSVATPAGMTITGGTIKGVGLYKAPSTSAFANSCTQFNGPDLLAHAKVNIHWNHSPATPPLQVTKIAYTGLGAGTVGGGVITWMGGATQVLKAGSFATPNPPNTVQLITNLPPISSCPVPNSPSTSFVISGGTITL